MLDVHSRISLKLQLPSPIPQKNQEKSRRMFGCITQWRPWGLQQFHKMSGNVLIYEVPMKLLSKWTEKNGTKTMENSHCDVILVHQTEVAWKWYVFRGWLCPVHWSEIIRVVVVEVVYLNYWVSSINKGLRCKMYCNVEQIMYTSWNSSEFVLFVYLYCCFRLQAGKIFCPIAVESSQTSLECKEPLIKDTH